MLRRESRHSTVHSMCRSLPPVRKCNGSEPSSFREKKKNLKKNAARSKCSPRSDSNWSSRKSDVSKYCWRHLQLRSGSGERRPWLPIVVMWWPRYRTGSQHAQIPKASDHCRPHGYVEPWDVAIVAVYLLEWTVPIPAVGLGHLPTEKQNRVSGKCQLLRGFKWMNSQERVWWLSMLDAI